MSEVSRYQQLAEQILTLAKQDARVASSEIDTGNLTLYFMETSAVLERLMERHRQILLNVLGGVIDMMELLGDESDAVATIIDRDREEMIAAISRNPEDIDLLRQEIASVKAIRVWLELSGHNSVSILQLAFLSSMKYFCILNRIEPPPKILVQLPRPHYGSYECELYDFVRGELN